MVPSLSEVARGLGFGRDEPLRVSPWGRDKKGGAAAYNVDTVAFIALRRSQIYTNACSFILKLWRSDWT
jgi:hypothetical protein